MHLACERYIGLMSGTSMDGVDAVLVDFTEPWQVLGHAHQPFEPPLREALLALNSPGHDELHRAALAAGDLARCYASVVRALRALPGAAGPVRAVGAHGQTVRHRPELGYTLQINQPALLAELTGLDVVADFRSRDVAAGGQGAPLATALHAARWRRPGETVGVLNLGGIANLSVLDGAGDVIGFDCGPASVLMDGWCRLQLGMPYDAQGQWAASGQVDHTLLQAMLADPYFKLPPPKTTGRDLFDSHWLSAHLARHPGKPAGPDVQRTLCELTALSVADAVKSSARDASLVVVCGGGARNDFLMKRIATLLAPVPVEASDRHGLAPEQVEAVAFAWLARQTLSGLPGNLASVTGARGARVLGAVYPAGAPAAP